jgi:trans-aconitate 2-methyltransferase
MIMGIHSREWNAAEYHRLSNPQVEWGRQVLSRIRLSGDEHVIDAGCGSGRLTAELVQRLPRGHVTAIDLSGEMARAARATLGLVHDRVDVVCADLLSLPLRRVADLVFSTATFHWVRDHDRLFRALHAALVPGGRIEAQCGGGDNLLHTKRMVREVASRPEFAPHFVEFVPSWYYATTEQTTRRLRDAGFQDVECWVEDAPTTFHDPETYHDFMRTVVLRPWLAHIAHAETRLQFATAVTRAALHTDARLTLDYQRLNIRARRT